MSKQSDQFFYNMLEFLPAIKNKYKEVIDRYGKLLETVVIEDVLMPEIIMLLCENKNTKLLENIFIYFEEVCNCEDEHLINIFSTTVLEVLGNDREILKIAQEYMGPKTKQFQMEADKDLGRI